MFDTKFWEEIKVKYPKVISKLMEYIHNKNQDYKNKVIINFTDICYCNIERFFDDNEIIIEIFRDPRYDNIWLFSINNKLFRIDVKLRLKAKLKAVKKAFEIMEEKL